ncbi:SET1 [Candida jiufengensis]|uniref:SET1 n=1 Tax=Candida jiufengensis TaxID=497108 RepID=UPI0022256E1A|nr:SET1 [Candida jiufengensis]KAI5955636.1 SET1 [Candida jiufengensis]
MSYRDGYGHHGYQNSYSRGGYKPYRSDRPHTSYKGSNYNQSYYNNHNNYKYYDNNHYKNHSGKSTPISVSSDTQFEFPTQGTDMRTGVNEKDLDFTKLAHHIDFTKQIQISENNKTYKVLYDPELDSKLSKQEKKTKHKKIRFNGDGITQVTDPRISNLNQYLSKPNKNSTKFPFKQLPRPKFIFDDDSLGEAPLINLVIWELPSSTNETYLSNFLNSFEVSKVEKIKLINDPEFGFPLGIATFKFQGSIEKSNTFAQNFIKLVNSDSIQIDGKPLKIGLNDNNDKFLNSKIDAARGKVINVQKKKEEEEKRRLKLIEEQKKEEEELNKKKKLEEEKKRKEIEATQKQSTEPPESKFKPNTTTLSSRHKNKVVQGVNLPKDLSKYIKNRPYILIQDKYVPTNKTPSQDIKRILKKYDWTRVLSDKSGFYVVFNSVVECERCFLKEDGRNFFEYKMVMEMAIPEGFQNVEKDNDIRSGVVDEATNILIKEFEAFLVKDIRERIIAPHILSLLEHTRYPKLIEELKAKEKEKEEAAKLKNISSNVHLKQNAMSILEKQRLELQNKIPYFKKANEKQHRRRPIIPMSHALNFDDDDDDEDNAEKDEDEEDEDDYESTSRSATPIPQPLKRIRSSTETSVDEEIEGEPFRKKSTTIASTSVYEEEDEMEVDDEPTLHKEELESPIPSEVEYDIDSIYRPTEDGPSTVYPESSLNNILDLESLQDHIKDDEDLLLAREILSDVKEPNIPNIEYWAWKQINNKEAAEEIIDGEDLIEELPSRLESKGCFKSDGYKKISDIDKIEYLPHRKKAHKPIKTVQYEDDEDEKPMENIQSSRVNRANNRRFAADITAQIGSESDVLSLNALTKRKKPVTFARSAIHNWGLYAMEPIAAKEMIIEYVGERIRQQVAEHREKSYLRTGIGSSYLFRIDENTVIDATKKGGIARFINHCCSPSCTAKIIKVEGKKRIVIYALRDIEANEELTYDYKFERETNDDERIRCLCGAPGCKGYLN